MPDLSKLSDEDLAALQSGDMSKMSDEGLSHISGQPAMPDEPSLRGGSVRGLIDLVRPGFTSGVGHGAVKEASLGNVDPSAASDDPVGQAVGKYGTKGAMMVETGGLAAAPATVGGRIAAGAALNGAEGALQKPEGDDTLGERAKNGGVSALLGGLLTAGGEGLMKLLGKGAKVASDIRDVKSGQMANRAAQAIDDAGTAINEQQVAPRRAQLEELVKGRTYSVNPDRVKPVFPRLGQSMQEGLAADAAPQGLDIAGGPDATAPARTDLSGARALRLKRAADSVADWSGSKPFDASATARGEDAEALANILRRQMNVDPEVDALNKGMQENLNLKQALMSREGTSPIETLTAKPGTSRGSIVDLADKAAGTKLRALGDDIDTARSLLLDPKKLAHPLSAPGEILRSGGRGAVEAAALANAAAKKVPVSKEALINLLSTGGGGGRN